MVGFCIYSSGYSIFTGYLAIFDVEDGVLDSMYFVGGGNPFLGFGALREELL